MSNLIKLVVSAAVAAMLMTAIFGQAAFADDWVATKLRGNVFALDGKAWVRLGRGDVISDNRVIRTTRSGRVDFARGKETISLRGDTQIRISDRAGQGYTVVSQHFGEVEFEAEKRDVKHFAVQTEFLAAVVKGTKFVVTVDGKTASVSVSRGIVEAIDRARDMKVDITPGQSAVAGLNQPLVAAGRGVAAITDLNGVPMSDGDVSSLGAGLNGGGGSSNGGLGGAIGGAVGGAANGVGDTLGGVGDALGGSAGDALGDVGDAVGDIGGGLGDAIGGLL